MTKLKKAPSDAGELVLTDDALPELPPPQPATPGGQCVPAKRPPLTPDFPDPEACPVLTAAREKYEKLVALWREAADEANTAYKKFGLSPGQQNTATIERVIVQAMAAGESIEDADELDRLYRTERRRHAAAELAAKEIGPAREAAVRRLNEAVRERLKPTLRALTLAKIAAVKAAAAHQQAVTAVKNAGFAAEPLHVSGGNVPLNPADAAVQLHEYVRLGIISEAELRQVSDLPAFYPMPAQVFRPC